MASRKHRTASAQPSACSMQSVNGRSVTANELWTFSAVWVYIYFTMANTATVTTTKTTTTPPLRRVVRPRARVIPLDDEPLTPADMKAIAEADAAFAAGEYCTLDDLQADLDRDVARLRSKQNPKRPGAKVSR